MVLSSTLLSSFHAACSDLICLLQADILLSLWSSILSPLRSTPLFSLHSAPIFLIYSSPPRFNHFLSLCFNWIRLFPSSLSDPHCPLRLLSFHIIAPFILLSACSAMYCLLWSDWLNLAQLCSFFRSSGPFNLALSNLPLVYISPYPSLYTNKKLSIILT